MNKWIPFVIVKIKQIKMDAIKYINPEGLMKSPAFSQVVTTEGKGKTIYIGGQNAVNVNHELVGKGDIRIQTDQVMQNIETALTTCGATFNNIVKLNIYIVQGQDVTGAYQASQKYMAKASHPPVVTAFFVSALGNPEYLLEVETTAFLPE